MYPELQKEIATLRATDAEIRGIIQTQPQAHPAGGCEQLPCL